MKDEKPDGQPRVKEEQLDCQQRPRGEKEQLRGRRDQLDGQQRPEKEQRRGRRDQSDSQQRPQGEQHQPSLKDEQLDGQQLDGKLEGEQVDSSAGSTTQSDKIEVVDKVRRFRVLVQDWVALLGTDAARRRLLAHVEESCGIDAEMGFWLFKPRPRDKMKDSERSLDDDGSKMKGDKRSLDEGSKMKDDKRSLDDGRSQLKDGGGSLDDKRSSMKDGGGSLDGKRELEEREEEELIMMESENDSIYGEEPLWVVKCLL